MTYSIVPLFHHLSLFNIALCFFVLITPLKINMDVSEISGTPKSSILIGFTIIFTIHFGVPLFLETPTWIPKKCGLFLFAFPSFLNRGIFRFHFVEGETIGQFVEMASTEDTPGISCWGGDGLLDGPSCVHTKPGKLHHPEKNGKSVLCFCWAFSFRIRFQNRPILGVC